VVWGWFWPPGGHFGHFWGVLGHFGPFWGSRGSNPEPRTGLGQKGPFWGVGGLSKSVLSTPQKPLFWTKKDPFFDPPTRQNRPKQVQKHPPKRVKNDQKHPQNTPKTPKNDPKHPKNTKNTPKTRKTPRFRLRTPKSRHFSRKNPDFRTRHFRKNSGHRGISEFSTPRNPAHRCQKFTLGDENSARGISRRAELVEFSRRSEISPLAIRIPLAEFNRADYLYN